MEKRQRQIQNRRPRNTSEQYQKAKEADELMRGRGELGMWKSEGAGWKDIYTKKKYPSPGSPPFLSRCLGLLDK
jgi:hypothetical protein